MNCNVSMLRPMFYYKYNTICTLLCEWNILFSLLFRLVRWCEGKWRKSHHIKHLIRNFSGFLVFLFICLPFRKFGLRFSMLILLFFRSSFTRYMYCVLILNLNPRIEHNSAYCIFGFYSYAESCWLMPCMYARFSWFSNYFILFSCLFIQMLP